MGGLEFFINNDELWFSDGKTMSQLTESSNIVGELFSQIEEFYPDAYDALKAEYGKASLNPQYFKFLCVRRFCKCNFGMLDNTKRDLLFEKVNFEKVRCPLRGECRNEGVICMPKRSKVLSEAELRVMELVYRGKDVKEISSLLFIAPNTVKNHIKSSYSKLGIHKISDFINYANNNNMFND